MRILHVVPDVSQEANGVSPVISGLSLNSLIQGHRVELVCLGVKDRIPGVGIWQSSKWPVLSKFEISFEMAWRVWVLARNCDIVHNHSLWSMINIACGWLVFSTKTKLVTSPHGTLSVWALRQSKRLKWLLWPLQRRVLAKADLLHATSEDELDDIRRLGFSNPVALIPNGITVPDVVSARPESGQKTLLFLSRIHPKKGIENLLVAWSRIQDNYPDWRLVIAGVGDDKFVRLMKADAQKLRLERVEFPGPLYGDDKSEAYSNAHLFVLPTFSENFGMVVGEALAHGCPAIVGRGAPWSGLLENECGWWIDNDIETLTTTLSQAMARDLATLNVMGLNGRAWMMRDFSWAAIAEKMNAAYQWLLFGGERPEWVKVVNNE